MLWGGGSTDGTDASRLSAFEGITSVPKWIIGMEEPDCPADGMSSGMSVEASAYPALLASSCNEAVMCKATALTDSGRPLEQAHGAQGRPGLAPRLALNVQADGRGRVVEELPEQD